MIHEFDEALRADPERFALAEKAAKLLDDVSLRTVVKTKARWRLPPSDSANAPRNLPPYEAPVVEVELRDDQGTEHIGAITLYERNDPLELKYRMSRIWGDLLEERSFLFYSRLAEPATELGAVRE